MNLSENPKHNTESLCRYSTSRYLQPLNNGLNWCSNLWLKQTWTTNLTGKPFQTKQTSGEKLLHKLTSAVFHALMNDVILHHSSWWSTRRSSRRTNPSISKSHVQNPPETPHGCVYRGNEQCKHYSDLSTNRFIVLPILSADMSLTLQIYLHICHRYEHLTQIKCL